MVKLFFRKLVPAVVGLVVVTGALPLVAEGPKPFPDFNSRFVKPPKPGQKAAPLVQIVPEATSDAVAGHSGSDETAAGEGKARYGWFWTSISPAMADSATGRLETILTTLANPPEGQEVAAPRLDRLLQIAEAHGPQILLNTVNTRVSPALVLSVIAVESGGQIEAISGAGAQGLMQLIPATAERFAVEDAMDPGQNIRGGVAYLDWLLREFQDDPVLALAAYNAGENAVKTHDGVPPFPETRDYVPKVMAAFAVARALCKTPPELISDGCVFHLKP